MDTESIRTLVHGEMAREGEVFVRRGKTTGLGGRPLPQPPKYRAVAQIRRQDEGLVIDDGHGAEALVERETEEEARADAARFIAAGGIRLLISYMSDRDLSRVYRGEYEDCLRGGLDPAAALASAGETLAVYVKALGRTGQVDQEALTWTSDEAEPAAQ